MQHEDAGGGPISPGPGNSTGNPPGPDASSAPIRQQVAERLFDEKNRIARRSRVREFVFGAMDGLLVPLGVVSGVAAGTGNIRAVIVAGLAEAFAGALSMAAGEYLSSEAETQVQQAEIAREQREIVEMPAVEREEVQQLFEHEGLTVDEAGAVSRILERHPESWINTMVEKELGLSREVSTSPFRNALIMGVSYIIAAAVPLAPYFFLPLVVAFGTSLILTTIALAVIGYVKGRLGVMAIWKSVLQVVVVGLASGAGGYVLGTIVPSLLERAGR